jgi:hypothetical protein
LRTSGSNLSSVCSSRRRLGFPARWTETLNPKNPQTPCPRSSSGGTGAVLRCGWQLRAVPIFLDPQASHARVRTGAHAAGVASRPGAVAIAAPSLSRTCD